MADKKTYKNSGHRGRLRDRFIRGGIEGLLDYEILELLLTIGTPRKDCKQIAKDAIKKFGCLRAVLDTPINKLEEIKGIGPKNAIGVKLFQSLSVYYEKQRISPKVSLNTSSAVAKYLQRSIGLQKKEHFVMLSLDSRNCLIAIDSISIGTLNSNLIHPREVFEPAIRNTASQVIVAHNHPSRDTSPSPEDIALTRRLDESAKILGIALLDHIIVSTDGYTSMKEQDLF